MPDRARVWRLSGDGLDNREVDDDSSGFSGGGVDVMDCDGEGASGNGLNADIGLNVDSAALFADDDGVTNGYFGVCNSESGCGQGSERSGVGGDGSAEVVDGDGGGTVRELGHGGTGASGIAETVGEWEKVLPGGVVSDSAELSFGDGLGDLFVESHIVVRLR